MSKQNSKNKISNSKRASRNFSGQAKFLGMRDLQQTFCYNTPKKGLTDKNFDVFSPRGS